jgi:glycosyltransferase involved in cell wall biosynthesis
VSTIHLLTPEYPPQIGGVAHYTRQIARALAAAGEDVHVWCSNLGEADSTDSFPVHSELGQFRTTDLARAGKLLDAFAGPQRVLVQWVPHGYGWRSMNLAFCLWLWKRAAAGESVEIMVHEPYLALWEGSWRQTAAAVIHRVMTMILLRAATRVWVAIPAWEAMWKPYALGRVVPFAWLPIPSSIGAADPRRVNAVRMKLASDSTCVAGHLGTYGAFVAPLLSGVLPEILRQPHPPAVVLIGTGSLEFRARFLEQYPQYAAALRATGALSDADLSAYVSACDLLIEPYSDGISSRRTSAMAALSLGVPLVTTRGRLSEPLWADSGSVRLTEPGDHRAMAEQVMDLVRHPEERTELGDAGRVLYRRMFDVSHTVDALRGAISGRAA